MLTTLHKNYRLEDRRVEKWVCDIDNYIIDWVECPPEELIIALIEIVGRLQARLDNV